jgi:outer membrane lipopolysaccharide assembly protein LptE/RlpB
MSRSIITTFALLVAIASTGCSFHARDAEAYRKVTREVLETRNGDIKGCYDKALEKNPELNGAVVITFKVEKDTGAITDVKLDKKASDADKQLNFCVLEALRELKIDPPDARDGLATFTWQFEAKKPG